MKQYLDLLQRVLDEGVWQENRTDISTKRIDGAMLQFDLTKGFPAITTKKLAFKAVVGELLGFIRAYDNSMAFKNLGCGVWDANANENEAWLKNPHRKCDGDLGRIYGQQWRAWYVDSCGRVDQLAKAIEIIVKDPSSRRIIVSAWNPTDLDKMALPPCHMMYQFLVNIEENTLSMCMYQRSCDMFLGIPFNIASYALLLELVAMVTGYNPGKLTMFLADVHIYRNHMDQVEEQLKRDPFKIPELKINPEILGRDKTRIKIMERVQPADIELVDYMYHPPIKGAMAV